MRPLAVGDRLPPLTVQTVGGGMISLGDTHHGLVLFFYPKNGSPICTLEACSFRDSYQEFTAVGAMVIGISGDSPESHEQFAAKHQLPFLLVSDADGSIRQALGVPKSLGVLPGRVTYVVDRDGIIRHIFSSQFDAARHKKEALEALKSLAT